jgi:hypothetical protein
MTDDRKWSFVLVGAIIGVFVVGIFPLRLWDGFLHDDAVAHLLSGVAITLATAGLWPGRDDALLAATAAAGLLWEVPEAVWFRCEGISPACVGEVLAWMVREDTLLDVSLVALGGVSVLIATRRYR